MQTTTENKNKTVPSSKKAKTNPTVAEKTAKPNVFEYDDFRVFLKEAYEYKKSMNPQYSENAFIFAAGFGKNSRGYLGLVLKGKRNLTSKSIVGFSSALGLNPKETLFFENLVLFNQAELEKEKIFYFERMKLASQGEKSRIVDILESQFRYVNEWHLIALREIVSIKGFREDVDWIFKKMNKKLSHDKITEGLKDLQNLGLLTRNQSGDLVQSDPVLIFKDNKTNFKNSSNLHKQFAERAAEAIVNEPYEKRAAQLITMTIDQGKFEALRKEMQEFTKILLSKYGNENPTEVVENKIVQMGIQLIHVTE